MLLLFNFSCKESTNKNTSKVDTLPYYGEATFTPHWFDIKDDSLISFHKIRPFTLINQLGDTITEKSLENKIYVVDFFFTTCPGLCPKMTTNMTLLQDRFLDDSKVMLLFHSVTPERDSVSVLAEYAENKGILSHKWYLLTGERQEIYNLGRKAYFVEEDLGLEMEEDDFLHTENFVLVDQNRHIRGIYNGLNTTAIAQLIAQI